MKTRLTHLWDALHTSYWFIPALMALGGAGLSFLTVYLDQRVNERWVRGAGWLWAGGAEGAREVLSTIASSMIALAGVTFSITIVALTLAASQFGPRVLRSFMSDTGNQIVLGTFVSTFLYCLLVLRTVRGIDSVQFVPYVSVTTGIVLAVAGVGVLIYFIHHVSESIQAEHLIASVAGEFSATMMRLFPEKLGESAEEGKGTRDTPEVLDLDQDRAWPVTAGGSGYRQAVEIETLMELASEHDLLLCVLHRPGAFIAAGDVLVQVWPRERRSDELAACIEDALILGRYRTPRQDAEYSLHQMVQIAVRALSPGINDPYTALICIDWLGALLGQMAERKIPSRYRYDEGGRLRVVADLATFTQLADAEFSQIRQYGRDHAMVLSRLLEVIADLAEHVEREEDRVALRYHAQLIEQDSREAIPDGKDRREIEECYQRALQALAGRLATTRSQCRTSV